MLSIMIDGIGTSNVTAQDIALVCDRIDELVTNENLFVSSTLDLRRRALEFQRHEMLVNDEEGLRCIRGNDLIS